jgi:hypothetical protein
VAAGAGAKPSTASAPRGFVNTGVPQARHRSGAGAAVIVIGLLLLPAVVALGWWAFNSMRGALQTRTATNTTSPSTDPSSQKPSEQPAATTDPASQTDPNQAKPGETPAVAPPATPGQEQPTQSPTVDANAAPSTDKPSEPPARPGDASRTADASQTSQPNPPSTNPSSANPSQSATQANASQNPPPDASRTPPANQSPDASRTAPANPPTATQLTDARRTPPANQSPGATQSNATQAADARRTAPANLTPGANQATVAPPPPPNVEPPRDAVTDRTRETGPNTVVRDPTRENTRRPGQEEAPREPAAENARREPAPPVRGREEPPPSTPADTRSLDYGSLGAFRGGSRSTGAASNVYSDAPSTAAAVARITYTLDAYGDAIAARDLDALRDVRSPVTPAESTMLKEGRLTVRFSNLDVSLDGNDARVRCRRAVVANGKTLSSGPADVRLTRRPDGWVITDIR